MGISLPRDYRASFSGPCLADFERSAELRQILERVKPRDTSYSQELVDGHVTTPNTLTGAPAAHGIENTTDSVAERLIAMGQAMPMRPSSSTAPAPAAPAADKPLEYWQL